MPSPLLESVETVTSTIGGCAAFGSALMCVRELGQEDRHWDEAMGRGSVMGALVGAMVLVAKMASSA